MWKYAPIEIPVILWKASDMIKKFKRNFLLASVLSLTLIIGIIIFAINFLNYRTVISDADEIIEIIMDNKGKFPSKPKPNAPDTDVELTPEAPFESRFFTVVYENGALSSVDTSSIAAISDSDAIKMARAAKQLGNSRGFYGYYRYHVSEQNGQTRFIFLDCRKSLDVANTFLVLSIFISMVGIVSVTMFLWLISKRVIVPLTVSYEKQKRFITNAGHDIKTPLTIINTDAELLEMEIGQNEWLNDIKNQSARLTSLTNELIYLSRMDEHEIVAHTDFPISEITEEIIDSFNGPAKAKEIMLNKAVSPALFYHGDESSIRKLITLLMDNAVKYSPEGEAVNIELRRHGRGVLLRISNLAPHLTDEAAGRLFERFYRADQARSSSGGFGIGLSVAEAIVGSHKGKISAEKQGNTFTIEVIL